MTADVFRGIWARFNLSKRNLDGAEIAAVQGGPRGLLAGMLAFNPDDLITRKGYAVYDQMQTDAQVAACLRIKKFAVLSKGWLVHPATGLTEDGEAAEFVRFCLDDMRGSVQDVLFNVLDAVAKGFSICEINYRTIERGRFAGKLGLASVKSKDPSLFTFDTDEYMNVRGLITKARNGESAKWDGIGSVSRSEQDRLPIEKFIIYSYMPRYESPYGQSDLRAAYKHWWSKDIILRFYNRYLEKYGSPTAKGSYKRGTPRSQQDELLRVLDKIQQETAIVIPDDVKIELLEAQRGGEAGFISALEFHDKQIAKAILGQTLTTDEGSRVGSLALAKVHLEILRYQLEKLKRDLEEVVMGEQLIRRLVDLNYAGASYPRFTLGSLGEKDIAALGDMIVKLVSGGVVAPDEAWIREELEIPNPAS